MVLHDRCCFILSQLFQGLWRGVCGDREPTRYVPGVTGIINGIRKCRVSSPLCAKRDYRITAISNIDRRHKSFGRRTQNAERRAVCLNSAAGIHKTATCIMYVCMRATEQQCITGCYCLKVLSWHSQSELLLSPPIISHRT